MSPTLQGHCPLTESHSALVDPARSHSQATHPSDEKFLNPDMHLVHFSPSTPGLQLHQERRECFAHADNENNGMHGNAEYNGDMLDLPKFEQNFPTNRFVFSY